MNAIRFFAGPFRRAPRVRDVNEVFDQRLTFGDRLADRVAAIGGSWNFIIGFGLFMVAWAILNTVVLIRHPFDPFPFIFLNLRSEAEIASLHEKIDLLLAMAGDEIAALREAASGAK